MKKIIPSLLIFSCFSYANAATPSSKETIDNTSKQSPCFIEVETTEYSKIINVSHIKYIETNELFPKEVRIVLSGTPDTMLRIGYETTKEALKDLEEYSKKLKSCK